jgi:uncharacterized protein (TIGR03790 family)
MNRLVLIVAVVCSGAASVRAELLPEEIAVVAARGSAQSEELAKYYAEKRGVPEGNICLVDLPRAEVCPRDQWTAAVRPAIRQWLDEHDGERKLRCLVTVWDVPLKIGPASSDAALLKYRTFLEGERKARLELLTKIAEQLDLIAADVKVTSSPAALGDAGAGGAAKAEGAAGAAGGAAKTELSTRQAKLEEALQAAQARIGKLAGEKRQQAAAQLQQLATLAGGARVLLQGIERQLNQPPDDPPQVRQQFDLLRGRASAFAEMKIILDQLPAGYHRDALALASLERNGGLLATIAWLDEQLATVDKNETGASFDSELAVVRWDDGYELLRWQPNYLRASYDNSQLRAAYPTLMVSRLDGPTFELAKGLVDKALAAEEAGLEGKAYIDGRGMAEADSAPAPPGSFADYDRALVALAKALGERTTIETVVNTSPALFQAGECPDAALYCGWYSLGKYIDAFEWQIGAVGYHLASSEAATLRDAASQVWCKKMIEDGVTATIGPVYEPYLASFPRPEEFFGLLLTGDLTLAECYWRTSPFTSWMQTLIGDPLYRPFKNHKVVKSPQAQAAAEAANLVDPPDAGEATAPGAPGAP